MLVRGESLAARFAVLLRARKSAGRKDGLVACPLADWVAGCRSAVPVDVRRSTALALRARGTAGTVCTCGCGCCWRGAARWVRCAAQWARQIPQAWRGGAVRVVDAAGALRQREGAVGVMDAANTVARWVLQGPQARASGETARAGGQCGAERAADAERAGGKCPHFLQCREYLVG